MKVCVTTSDKYHHCLPIFFKQYAMYWNDPFELVGYKKPEIELPENCTWISLGEQGDVSEFSTDLREYFKQQPDFFVWLMEDTFIKGFNRHSYEWIQGFCLQTFGRINLTKEGTKQKNIEGVHTVTNTPDSNYRLSTQPSIWNKNFLLRYMKPGLTPWQFETQKTLDGFDIIGPKFNIVEHNEGVRKNDIHKLNLEGL